MNIIQKIILALATALVISGAAKPLPAEDFFCGVRESTRRGGLRTFLCAAQNFLDNRFMASYAAMQQMVRCTKLEI